MEKKMEKLVKKAQKGSKNAFEELVKLKSSMIVYTTNKMLGDFHEAEDVSQEIVIKMYKNIKSLKDPSAFNAWIKRIIINECYDYGRKKGRRNETTGVDEIFGEIMEEDREFIPQEYAENKEQRLRIRTNIDSLSKEKQLILTMYYYEQMTYSEIAYAMDKSKGYVSSAMRRAKDSIRKELEKDPEFNEKMIDRNAATPVLSVVLTEQVLDETPRSSIESLMAFTHDKVLVGSSTKSLAGGSMIKLLSIVVITSLVVTSGTVFTIGKLNNNLFHNKDVPAQQIGTDEYEMGEAEIIFDENSSENAHINPETITLTKINKGYVAVSWKIVNNKTNKELTGKGVTISKEVKNLYENGNYGSYTVFFVVEYPYGNLDASIDFKIIKDNVN